MNFEMLDALQATLNEHRAASQLRRERVKGAKPLQVRHAFGELGVVLHGAGAEGVEVAVDAAIHPRETGEVADHLRLGDLGQAGVLGAQVFRVQFGLERDVVVGHPHAAAPRPRLLEDQFHKASSSASAYIAISCLVRFSVTATSRYSFMSS